MHHVALLIGYGAAAVNPYLAFESIEDLVAITGAIRGRHRARRRSRNYVKALSKGVLKVMSKMGISHDRVLHRRAGVRGVRAGAADVVDEYFGGTPVPARRGRSGRARRARPRPGTRRRTRSSRPRRPIAASTWAVSTSGGARASCTCSTPRRCSCCSTRPGSAATRCSGSTPRRSRRSTARAARCAGCSSCEADRPPVPIDEVEPVVVDRAAGSPPARCPTARSRPRRTRRSRSR